MTDCAGREMLDGGGGAGSQLERALRARLPLMGVDGGGVALVRTRGHRATVCATDDVAARVEEAQFILGDGPCVDASASRSPVLVADLLDPTEGVQDRWPGFVEAACAVGVRAVFAFPLRIGAIALGVMDVYRATPGDLSVDQIRAGLMVADAAQLLLLDGSTDTIGSPDSTAVRSSYRLQVHSAAEMVKVQLGVSIEEALVRLRAAAFAQGRSVNEVAMDVVTGRLRFPEEDA